jgi:sugar phosphate permease
MVDIAIVFMGIISWFINQFITGGPHPESISMICNWWVKVPKKDRGSKVVSFTKVVSVPA